MGRRLKDDRVEGKTCRNCLSFDVKDSPIFRSTAEELEKSSDISRNKLKKMIQGAHAYCRSLDDAFHESWRFAASVEAFGEGNAEEGESDATDQIIKRFVQMIKELSSFVELLRTQVELLVCDRLDHRCTRLLESVKSSSKALSQRSHEYDGIRSRHLGHRSLAQRAVSGGRGKVPGDPQTQQMALSRAKLAADEARFELARSLVAFKDNFRCEILETVSSVMQAHMKYFEHGDAAAAVLGPYVDASLVEVDAARKRSKDQMDLLEEMIELQRVTSQSHEAAVLHAEGEKLHEEGSPASGPLQVTAATSELAGEIEKFISRTTLSKGKEVTVLKQGYLLKRSSSMKSKWQRRYFVLDSTGRLYYWSSKLAEHGVGLESLKKNAQRPHNTVNLVTAAIKPGMPDEEKNKVPFSFRIVSPEREYALQAEDEIDAKAWMDTLQGVIICLLSGSLDADQSETITNEVRPLRPTHSRDVSADISALSLPLPLTDEVHNMEKMTGSEAKASIFGLIGAVKGNQSCADCGAPSPDWGSLNLGSLHCIECSGFHRKLGVHISKIRSLNLDTKVWDSAVIEMFQQLGNTKINAVWEALIPADPSEGFAWSDDMARENTMADISDLQNIMAIAKPSPTSCAAEKERFIIAKYRDKAFVPLPKDKDNECIWHAIEQKDFAELYNCLVCSVDIHKIPLKWATSLEKEAAGVHPATVPPSVTSLHLACKGANLAIIELLLQWGLSIDAKDSGGKTPLMYSLYFNHPGVAKYLIRRGSSTKANDSKGVSVKQYMSESLICAADHDLVKSILDL